MPEHTEIQKDSLYRFNAKQSAKGETYCEFTVRGDTKEEIETRSAEMVELVKKYSTVVKA